MLQHHTTSHYHTHFDRHQHDSKNQLLYPTSHSINSLLQEGRPTSHVPPLLSSALCSNNHKPSSFSDSSMSSSNKYHCHQQLDYHGRQYNDVEQSQQQQQQQQQTLSADELHLLTAPTTPSLINDNIDSFSNSGDLDDTSSLVNLSRRLRTNLSLAKQRMMMGLKQSTEPNDIAIYTQLESITLNDPSSPASLDNRLSPKAKPSSKSLSTVAKSTTASTASSKSPRIVTSTVISKTVGNGRNLFSHDNRYPIQPSSISSKTHNKHRVHKKRPYNSNSSYMELQTNSNGYVSVVLRKKSSSSSEDSFATLARSFSFNICEGDDSDPDSDSDSDIYNDIDNDNDNDAKRDGNMQSSSPPPSNVSCYGDTLMNDPTVLLDHWTTISPRAITMSTTSESEPFNPLSAAIGVNSNDQGIGMNWNMSMMDRLSPTWMEDMEYTWQQQGNPFENKPVGLEQLDENTIDSWLQRGGFGYGPLVAATDQEMADLLDFD
ncbi:hypothetical protein BCR42DRAFT_423857 [Absidia repens]|uniref:Uncharacterized protein n=1 Tax=Absidia repens TaxID=90262 RepID=A0A1X2I4C2_9FUNG|nr:hypothetical protein BCR42DRAFT_423857 [Absidia repens]